MSEQDKQGDERSATWRIAAKRLVLVIVAGLAALAVTFFASEHYTRKARVLRRVECWDHLHRIGKALNGYCAVYGQLPPECTRAPDGRMLLSWRVLILPYLGDAEKALFEDFDLDEPWNGPNNSKLLQRMPELYRCPEEVRGAMWTTSYVMLMEPESARNENSEETKGQNLPLVVDVSGLDIAWSEPRDFNSTELPRLFAVPPAPQFPRNHYNILNVLSREGFIEAWEVTEELSFPDTSSDAPPDREGPFRRHSSSAIQQPRISDIK